MEIPKQKHPVSQATHRRLVEQMREMVWLNANTRGTHDTGHIAYSDGNPHLTDGQPNSVGSGQVYDPQTTNEYVVWLAGEGGAQDVQLGAEVVRPLGFVHELSADPQEASLSVSRSVVPVGDGRVFEVCEGTLPSRQVAVRQLGETDVESLVASMSAAASHI
ncbi:hypothetical protein KC878_04575 [Candidatus Saccharibacteria bacterium]|nr:hypothetical protein [Candidatus Saccharibacteria bacterium]MCB9821222.1 hypothetical protein [Candidatus Nomurabacteria bacterium]